MEMIKAKTNLSIRFINSLIINKFTKLNKYSNFISIFFVLLPEHVIFAVDLSRVAIGKYIFPIERICLTTLRIRP